MGSDDNTSLYQNRDLDGREENGSSNEVDAAQEVPSTRERDEEFWYEDGNVILVAGKVEFRVFKGILADHSPVFKDMFSLPQPEPSSSEDPVCPVVHLSDSPLDLRRILRICMPKAQSSPFKFRNNGPSFNTISALIRLGHKYQMSALVVHAFDYLTEFYPSVPDEWDKYPDYGPPAFDDVHAISVVNFARTFDRPMLLPTALLACAVQPGQALIHGCKLEDGLYEMLSADDLARCIHARGGLAAACAASAIRVFRPVVDNQCERSKKCLVALRKMLEGLDGVAKRFGDCDPTQSPLWLYENIEKQVCLACHRMLRVRSEKERCDMWAALPDILDVKVEGWAAK